MGAVLAHFADTDDVLSRCITRHIASLSRRAAGGVYSSMSRRFLLLSSLLVLVNACQCGGGPADCPDIYPTAPQATASDGTRLRVDLDRDGRDILVDVYVTDPAGVALTDEAPTVAVAGDDADVERVEDHFRAVITHKPGEVPIDVDVDIAGGLHVRRTALVLPTVNERWGQPFMAEGLVNTCGWEDGAAQSPDGEWLFTQSLPVAFQCIATGGDCSIRGEVEAPMRPNFPGADRVHDGEFDNACPSLGYNWVPPGVHVPPNSFYGFRRQADGSYGEPFPLFIDGTDGCFGAFGYSPLSLSVDDEGRTHAQSVWSFDNDSKVNVHTGDIVLGDPAALGTFTYDQSTDTRAFTSAGELVDGGDEYKGNPTVARNVAGEITAVVYDDETASEVDRDLFAKRVDGAFPNLRGERTRLPVSEDGIDDKMPFFGDGHIVWARGYDIASATFNGGDVLDGDSYGPTEVELAGQQTVEVGDIFAVAEPNTSTRDGRRRLSFIYVAVRADGTFDLNLGLVDER
jgi:hypothetical protein